MNDLPLPLTDILVFAVILISAIFAMIRGFTHEVLSIGSWLAAVLVVVFGLPYARPHARNLIATDWIADAVAAAVLFFVTLIIAAILTRSPSKSVHDSALSPVDRALGFLFGIARGALLITVAYMAMIWVLDIDQPPKWMRGAKTTPWIVEAADTLTDILPDNLLDADISKTAEDSKRAAKDAMAVEKTLREWSAPASKQPDDAPQGYAEDQRRDMNRLIDANR